MYSEAVPALSPMGDSPSSSVVIHRPLPVHPLLAAEDVPLDLSAHSSQPSSLPYRHTSVIQSPPRRTIAASPPPPSSLLPTCSKPNSSLLALRLQQPGQNGPNRMSYPREFKLLVIDYFHCNGQNKYRTCKEFQITKSMLNGWLQKTDKIKASRPGSLKSGRSGRRPQFPLIEKQLFQLYAQQVEAGHKVGNRWIRDTARELAARQCSSQQLTGMCQFSERWLSNFKKRFGIQLSKDGASSSSASSGDAKEGWDSEADDDSEDDNSFSLALSLQLPPSSPSASAMSAQEILSQRNQLPIHTFYEKFPWLRRKTQALHSPARRGRKVQFPDVEKALALRLHARLSRGEKATNRWLLEQARELAAQLCPEALESASRQSRCLFSEHWLHNFKKRHGVSLRASHVSDTSPTPSSSSQSSSSVSPSSSSQSVLTPWLPPYMHSGGWPIPVCAYP